MTQQQLRRQLLDARASVSNAARDYAALQVGEHLLQLPELQQPCQIGSYFSVKAELPTHAINQRLMAQAHQLSLPILHPFRAGHLLFMQLNQTTQWTHNRFGIPEPELDVRHVTPLNQLNVLLVPLVGFDALGNRMGMGGGFYDRTLSAWRQGKINVLPIGLAMDCQYVDTLPVQPWDVPLSMVITPSKVWDFRG
ncbi:5-formyltetrahydrofolate cyclo-ligase [Pseudidiomarina maritima]|uniref:5-formyltetrahydrofolate cyclo-ligase n=1 Tax=Pseudidiomarina maritima TaxID=519453 RepID=A0A1I6HUG1_9GAMM|nr:5-formyltetrahydrofolate cyclo-ligase [Pseudidiomarina maritima]SFR58063.1 5-formyltetrahydrofolate cyclo-ligase [Pseudidiomarina maritima]